MNFTRLLFCLFVLIVIQLTNNQIVSYKSEIETNTKYERFNVETENNECIILNKEYKNQYLYAVYAKGAHARTNRNTLWRDVLVWAPIFSSGPKEFTDKDESGLWIFKPVIGKPHTYFILNRKFGEYLFSTEDLGWSLIPDKNRRSIKTYKPKDTKLDEEFMWSFKRLDNGLYEIWNLKYAERNYIKP